jgi:hypothetical protein
MAQGGGFLIATQSDLANSIGLYCDPISLHIAGKIKNINSMLHPSSYNNC